MRAARAGRHGPRHRVQPRSGRAGARLRDAGLPPSARGRSRRRLRGQADERGRGRAHPRDRRPVRAARRRHPRHGDRRGLARQGRRPRDHRHRRGARPGLREGRRRANFPSASRSASTPATARSRRRAGPRPPSSPRSISPRRFEDAGVAAIIYTDIARDGLLKGLNLDATIALADAISIPVIASGGLASIEDVKADARRRARRSCRARSRAARSTTGGSMRPRRWR